MTEIKKKSVTPQNRRVWPSPRSEHESETRELEISFHEKLERFDKSCGSKKKCIRFPRVIRVQFEPVFRRSDPFPKHAYQFGSPVETRVETRDFACRSLIRIRSLCAFLRATSRRAQFVLDASARYARKNFVRSAAIRRRRTKIRRRNTTDGTRKRIANRMNLQLPWRHSKVRTLRRAKRTTSRAPITSAAENGPNADVSSEPLRCRFFAIFGGYDQKSFSIRSRVKPSNSIRRDREIRRHATSYASE